MNIYEHPAFNHLYKTLDEWMVTLFVPGHQAIKMRPGHFFAGVDFRDIKAHTKAEVEKEAEGFLDVYDEAALTKQVSEENLRCREGSYLREIGHTGKHTEWSMSPGTVEILDGAYVKINPDARVAQQGTTKQSTSEYASMVLDHDLKWLFPEINLDRPNCDCSWCAPAAFPNAYKAYTEGV